MLVHLIRHGQTEATERRQYCGWTDLPLSSQGRDRIIHLAQQSCWPVVQHCFCSDLNRAIQTAAIFYPDTPTTVLADLREFHFGVFEGQTYETLQSNPDYQNWIDHPESVSCPDGENQELFVDRIQKGWRTVLSSCNRSSWTNVSIVCHGGVIATWMMGFFPGQANYYDWLPACGEGYHLSLSEGRPQSFSPSFAATGETRDSW